MRASYWSIETQTASFTAFASVNSDDADSQETAFKSLCLHFCKQNENIIRVYISMMSRANYVQKCSQYHLNCTEQKQFLYVRNIFFTGMECHPWYLDQLPLGTKLQPRR